MFRSVLRFLLLLGAASSAGAQDGTLDTSFVSFGYEFFDYSGVPLQFASPSFSEWDYNAGMIVLADGRVVVLNSYHPDGSSNGEIVLRRFLADGSSDSGFTTTPITGVQFASGAVSVAVQSTGKIVVLAQYFIDPGDNHFTLFRFLPNGGIDDTFGTQGRLDVAFTQAGSSALVTPAEVLVQGDDKIIIAGSAYAASASAFIAMRLAANGAVDNAYGGNNNGQVLITRFGDLQSSAASENLFHARLTQNGSLVLGGWTHPTIVNNMGFPQVTSAYIALAQLTSTGALDSGFGNGGVVIFNSNLPNSLGASNIAVTRAGSVYAVTAGNAALRFTSTGALDTQFGGLGIAQIATLDPSGNTSAPNLVGIAVQAQDGKILLSGSANYGSNPAYALVVRLLPDGTADADFGTPNCGPGVSMYPLAVGGNAFQETAPIVATQFGRVVATGTARFLGNTISYVPFLMRLNVDRIFYAGNEVVP